MTRMERLLTLSAATCCLCERQLSVQELQEFYGMADEELRGDVYCRSCVESHLVVCPECSNHYTAGGICGECTTRIYGMVG